MERIETAGEIYEYRGLMARFWDALRGDTTDWPDQILYRNLALRRGGATLDVGCGTGRLLLDLLARGVEIDGVDNSPEMLALCREKAARQGLSPILYEQSMQRLDLPRRYRSVFVPSSSFQLLTDPADASAAMARFVAHLEPGGLLALPFMELWRDGEPLSTDWEGPREATLEDGAVARRYSRSDFDPATRCESTEDRYELWQGGARGAQEVHRRAPATRSYTQAEARAALEEAGLVEVGLWHAFDEGMPARPDDRLFTVFGFRAS